ncbi:hypothetical protein LMG27198_28170 [Methylocystis echinoides]|uniref:Uncharacterized protein n=2 Tax=Methylocystis echinoides TaxID=29468 RepID=A0A9W6GVW8_9HYPH|nr:hypothetical protein LMG27198_28170 [Methylocystis echinoides]
MVPTLHGAYHMTRFNKALLASASLAVLATAAEAQVYNPATAFQGVTAVDWVDPIYITNLAGAVGDGKGNATSEVVQIASIALNQFGASGSLVGVDGDYAVVQDFAFGPGEEIDVLNSNSAFTPGGFSRAGGSQIISTAINNIGVDLKFGGQTFAALQTFGPENFPPAVGTLSINQNNSITAGYDTNGLGNVGTGGSAIVGIAPESSTNTSGLQVNAVSINTVTVNLPDFNAAADIKIAQNVDATGLDVDLFNIADAGAQNGAPGPNPPVTVIDPLVQNLQQIASFSANTATVTGGTTLGGQIEVGLGAAFDTTGFPVWDPVPNQNFSGDADVDLFNFASALTWAEGSYGGPTSDWFLFNGGKGDVNIGGAYSAGVSGPVKQIAAFTVNTVSGPTSEAAGLSTDKAKVFAGTINTDPNEWPPLGLTPFSQVADLSDVSVEGRWGTNGGAGIDIGLLLAFAANNPTLGFPGYTGTGGVPVAPNTFDWTAANNTAIAGTSAGNAKIHNLDQIAAVTANSFSFDNSVRDADGKITSANTDVVNGAVDQFASLSNVQLANVALAMVGVKGTATLDTVNQTNAYTVNSFSAGVADFNTGVVNPTDPATFISGGLNQEIETNGAILNLGNAAVAYGTNAIAKDVKQINAVSLNTGTINTVAGGTINQVVSGGLNVNSGNYLSAIGTVSASITGAQQIGVVNVNSIVGAPVAP